MSVIATGNHPKALWPGVHKWWGVKYNEHPVEWKDLFETQSSEKAYEEDVETTGFGLAPVKPQGQATSYDTHQQGYTKRYTHVAYSLGAIVTREEMADNLYKSKAFKRTEMLAFSARQSKEIVHANVYNRAFTADYSGGDGKELLATDHPTNFGDQSNELAVAADLSEASLEDLIIQIMGATNARGLNIKIMPRCLIVPRQLWFEANRILKSTLQNDTANNAVNVLKATNSLPDGIKMNHYLTDQDAWFVRTNCPTGLQSFQRESIQFTQDNDFDTDNAKMKFYERYSVGWTDWRQLYGSPGA